MMERWIGWMDTGREPTADLSRWVVVNQLAAGGAEICCGFSHLVLLLLHRLLKETEKDMAVSKTDRHTPK